MRWQVWTALLVYVLLRYLSYVSQWAHSFTRLFTILRAALWEKLDLLKLLACYGTAGAAFDTWRKRTSVFPRLPLNLWDSTTSQTRPRGVWNPDPVKSKSHLSPGINKTLENQHARTKIIPLWDGCEIVL